MRSDRVSIIPQFGIKERGGPMITEVVPNVRETTLAEHLLPSVERGSTVSTDELHSYRLPTEKGYSHGAVKHSIKQYAKTDEAGIRHHVNHVESFWKLFKSSIR